MIFDPFVTLGYVEDIKVLVQPSNTVPYCAKMVTVRQFLSNLSLLAGASGRLSKSLASSAWCALALGTRSRTIAALGYNL